MDIELRIPRIHDVLRLPVLKDPSAGELRALRDRAGPDNPHRTLRGIETPAGVRYFWDAALGIHDRIGSHLALQEGFPQHSWRRLALRGDRLELDPPGF